MCNAWLHISVDVRSRIRNLLLRTDPTAKYVPYGQSARGTVIQRSTSGRPPGDRRAEGERHEPPQAARVDTIERRHGWRPASLRARPDAGHRGRCRARRAARASAGDGRRLDHPGLHERRRVPHGSVVAGDHRPRARPARRAVPLPRVRAAERAGRAAVRSRTGDAQPGDRRRPDAVVARAAQGRAVAARLHGPDRGLLGGPRRRPVPPGRDLGPVPQPRRLRRRPARHRPARRRHHRQAVARPGRRRPGEPDRRTRQRPGVEGGAGQLRWGRLDRARRRRGAGRRRDGRARHRDAGRRARGEQRARAAWSSSSRTGPRTTTWPSRRPSDWPRRASTTCGNRRTSPTSGRCSSISWNGSRRVT